MRIYATGDTRMGVGKDYVDGDVGVCGRFVWTGL
jgi:hypothetical protein